MSSAAPLDRLPAMPRLDRYAETLLPTRHGSFRCIVYRDSAGLEHVAMVCGTVADEASVLCRVHSECLTSEVLGSLKCDCKQQLDAALQTINQAGQGVVLYLRQEGRGIGLGNKIRAYALQEFGLDTVDANRHLGLSDDLRSYDIAAAMLADLQVYSVRLLTNNPDKVEGLREFGVPVDQRVPIEIAGNEHSHGYLRTKRDRMGHLLDHLDEDGDA